MSASLDKLRLSRLEYRERWTYLVMRSNQIGPQSSPTPWCGQDILWEGEKAHTLGTNYIACAHHVWFSEVSGASHHVGEKLRLVGVRL